MGDLMRPVPFKALLTRIFDEYHESRSIFGIPEKQFYRKHDDRRINVFNESCETPLGPAAGPHTQLAQNIIVSWLTGGRFIELKTVQILESAGAGKTLYRCRRRMLQHRMVDRVHAAQSL